MDALKVAEYYIIDYAKNFDFKYFILRQSCIWTKSVWT